LLALTTTRRATSLTAFATVAIPVTVIAPAAAWLAFIAQ
jgi:hypothetical protein